MKFYISFIENNHKSKINNSYSILYEFLDIYHPEFRLITRIVIILSYTVLLIIV